MRLHDDLENSWLRRIRCAWLALVLLAPSLAAAGDDGDGLFMYRRNGTKESVTPIPWSIGVHSKVANTDEVIDFLDAAGYQNAKIVDVGLFDWWFVELRDASDPPPVQGVAGLIATFLDLDRRWRFFFAPELQIQTSRHFYFSQAIIAEFEEGVVGRRIDELLAAAGASVADIEQLGAGTNTYRIETRHRSGLDVLKSANRLFLSPEVVYAYPDGPFSGGLISSPPDGGDDSPDGIPVLSEWSLVLLGVAISIAAMVALRGRRSSTRC